MAMRRRLGHVKYVLQQRLRTLAAWYVRRTDNRIWERDGRDARHTTVYLGLTLNPDDNCVDVGAHSGTFLREFLRYSPQGRHVAFEPIPALAAQLERDFPMVDVHNAAVSDAAGEVTFTYAPEAPGYSGFRVREYPVEVHPQQITVRAETLDDVLPEDYVPRLIKIDVEGAELQVLHGARRTLERHQPIVMLEHGKGAADYYGTTPDDVFALLDGHGYRLFDIDGNGPYTLEQLVDVFDSNAYWNFVARP